MHTMKSCSNETISENEKFRRKAAAASEVTVQEIKKTKPVMRMSVPRVMSRFRYLTSVTVIPFYQHLSSRER